MFVGDPLLYYYVDVNNVRIFDRIKKLTTKISLFKELFVLLYNTGHALSMR